MSQSVERREKLRTSGDLIINGTKFGKDKHGRRWTGRERERERDVEEGTYFCQQTGFVVAA